MRENLLQMIWHHLFGYKYYTTVFNVRGTFELGVGGRIFSTRKEAERSLDDNTTYKMFEVVSFWSRNKYILGSTKEGYNCNYLAEDFDYAKQQSNEHP
ncbi:MAG: hypothetical protein J6Y15_10075 [Bacteroidaceae bacterium]|nr:hypothetical protein [Bacteroidaceae bacterium]